MKMRCAGIRSASRHSWPRLLTAAVVLTSLCIAASARSAVVYRGDLNRDGKVTIADAILAIRMAAKIVPIGPEDLLAGDVWPSPGIGERDMGDGKITTQDAIRILQYVIGLISATDFYGGKAATVQTEPVMLTMDLSRAQEFLFGTGVVNEAPIIISITGTERIAMGGVTLGITAVNGGPTVNIVRVEPGASLSSGAPMLTVPSPLPEEGAPAVRAAFSLMGIDPIDGAGQLFRFIIKPTAPVPNGARYRLALSYPDFSSDQADALVVQTSDAVLASK